MADDPMFGGLGVNADDEHILSSRTRSSLVLGNSRRNPKTHIRGGGKRSSTASLMISSAASMAIQSLGSDDAGGGGAGPPGGEEEHEDAPACAAAAAAQVTQQQQEYHQSQRPDPVALGDSRRRDEAGSRRHGSRDRRYSGTTRGIGVHHGHGHGHGGSHHGHTAAAHRGSYSQFPPMESMIRSLQTDDEQELPQPQAEWMGTTTTHHSQQREIPVVRPNNYTTMSSSSSGGGGDGGGGGAVHVMASPSMFDPEVQSVESRTSMPTARVSGTYTSGEEEAAHCDPSSSDHRRQRRQQQQHVVTETNYHRYQPPPAEERHYHVVQPPPVQEEVTGTYGGNQAYHHAMEALPVALKDDRRRIETVSTSSLKDKDGDINSRRVLLQRQPRVRNVIPRPVEGKRLNMLKLQGFSTGLARALVENSYSFDHRVWVVDNSGSMQLGDGHRIVASSSSSTGKKNKNSTPSFNSIPCTRWEELQDAVKYHAQMAALMDSPTVFKFLNDPGCRISPPEFSVADRGQDKYNDDIEDAMKYIKHTKPDGVTPLTKHIQDIRNSVAAIADDLREIGKKVVVILATDGLPTDSQGYGGEYVTSRFMEALRSLEGLPVWVVIRLCTDEDDVTNFYNALDGQLEVSLEVLDDFVGEAREVYEHNKWLNYALPIHRCRELGYHNRLFDFIDERPLTRGELREFCSLLFGVSDDDDELPDPGMDFPGFVKGVERLLKHEDCQWNPIKEKAMPWINMKHLVKIYGNKKKVWGI